VLPCWQQLVLALVPLILLVHSTLTVSLLNAHRAYDMAKQGVPADVVAASASGEKSVVTDADNTNIEEKDGKGFNDAR